MPVYSFLDRLLLEDERIRKIIKSNEKLIRELDKKKRHSNAVRFTAFYREQINSLGAGKNRALFECK